MNKESIILFSSGDFAIPTFKYLIEKGFNIVGVVTSDDKVLYNDKKISELCADYSLPFYIVKGKSISDDDGGLVEFLKEINGDIYCVISFKKLPSDICKMANKSCFNVHASLLPFLRGAAPITHAIRLGLKETGLTAFLLTENIDCGPIIANVKVGIEENDTYETLFQRLSQNCCQFTEKVLNDFLSIDDFYNYVIEQQQFDFSSTSIFNEILTAPKIDSKYYNRHWRRLLLVKDAANLLNSVPNGFMVQIVVYDNDTNKIEKIYKAKIHKIGNIIKKENFRDWMTTESDGKKYISLHFYDGYFDIEEIQLVGKNKMSVSQFLNGFRYFSDDKHKVIIDDLTWDYGKQETSNKKYWL